MSGKAEHAFEKATSLLKKGDFKGSLPYFRAAIEQAPNSYRAHHNLALALYHLADYDGSAAEFQKAIDLTNGGFAPSLFGLSMILYDRADFRHAETLIRNGLFMDPGSSLGHYCLGLVQFSLGRIADAERSAHDALSGSPRETDSYVLLARIHERLQNPYAVVSDIQAYLKADPNGPLREDALQLLQHAQLNLANFSASLQ